ncbi:hypothetical protein [Capnocytophaga felis]|uniref:hypothetical protein n=1 Tax=Capnocytophaga felis TaxID=2267611 RepID=UPI0012D2AC39|nr:hypothetical protein [Capnocytophaga felis]
MMVVLIVRLSKVRENGVCDEALLLQGFDFAQPDRNTSFLKHHIFYHLRNIINFPKDKKRKAMHKNSVSLFNSYEKINLI